MSSMTKAGQELFNEYLSERREAFEDETPRLRWLNLWHALGGIKTVSLTFIKAFYVIWVTIIIMISLFIDTSTIALLKSSTPEKILEVLNTFGLIVVSVTILQTLIMISCKSSTLIRNSKQEWLDSEKAIEEEVKNTILISEELLRRHQLIENEANM